MLCKAPWALGEVLLFVTALIVLPVGGGLYAKAGETSERGGQGARSIMDFRWVPSGDGRAVEHITAGKETAVPVEIGVEGDIAELTFQIPRSFRAFGIRLDRQTAEVRDGKAHVTVYFNIPQGMPHGRHDLVIHVLERRTGRRIGSGTIPFIFLPSAVECHC